MRWPKLCKAIEYVVDRHGPIDGRTRLLELVYLADQRWLRVHGATYTEASYYRWNHGPFSREFLQALDWISGVEILERRHGGWGVTSQYHSGDRSRLSGVHLDERFQGFLDDEAARWRSAPVQELMEHVYSDDEFGHAHFGEKLLSHG